ncbi:cysteine hydrolase family protein [Dyella ginsengisoli]|uniref:cysteine hydrolase family protein n=1 Tax=Dyella ginsengisoli TaxID=363848 RepID=UPI00037AF38D|nr:cysteine hydrolase family protein [Dyella ginsengisoli]
MLLPRKTALIVIDVQQGFNDPRWGARNNPGAEANIARLLATFRAQGRPVIHVHHDSAAPDGAFRPGTPGNRPKPETAPREGEPVYRKSVNSAFIGTTLERDLRAAGIEGLVVTGLTTNHCVSATTRMAGNLGFDTFIVADATATFARIGLDGAMRPPEEVHLSALSDLKDEFATVVDTDAVIAVA